MTAGQLQRLRDIREDLEDIRGNEEEVEAIRRQINMLIRASVDQAKNKIEVLANLEREENPDLEDFDW